MKRLQTPQVFNDLYRDLRDRRLLIPAAAILVAILAVPFLLSGGDEAPAPVAVAAAPEGATQVAPAVLAEESGIRDYRKRLSALKAQNPFEEKFKAPQPAGDGEDSDTAAPAPAASGVPSSPSTGSSTPAGVSDMPSGEDGDLPSTSPQPDVAPPSDPADPPKPEIRFYVGRADIAFGQAGNAKTYEDVRELDFIPDDKNPMVSFIGLAGNGNHAVFGITPSIVETRGDGSCAPKDGCQFLRLAEGDVRYLKADNGKTFRLKLLETQLVRIPDPRD